MTPKIALERIEKAIAQKATSLDLSYLGLKQIPPEIAEMSEYLQILYLNSNQLTKIENLDTLVNLQRLDLALNQLTKIENLDTLVNLQLLDLALNQLTKIENLDTLINLQTLSLYSNQLAKIENLDKLVNLQGLDLSSNQLIKIENLDRLVNLQRLYLSLNQLTNIENLKQHTKLTNLHLHNNQIEALPSYFLDFNRLTTNILSEELKDYIWNKGLTLHGNLFPISEAVFDWEPQEIIVHILRVQEKKAAGQVKPLLEAKVMFVGDSEVGKTHLIEVIRKQAIEREINSTHGIERNYWHFGEVKANIWDLGGQEYMRATHQFFFSALSVYVLVAQSRKERKEINAWMQQIRQWGGENAPVIIVGNKCDLNIGHKFPESEIMRDYPNILGFVYTSIHQLDTIETLKAKITEVLADKRRMKWVYEERENEWHAIKDEIEKQSQCEEYIGYDEYLKLCRKCVPDMDENICKQTLLLLNATGTVVSFIADKRLIETQVLNPQWVVDGVYAIINDEKVKEAQKGYFTENDLERILEKTHKARFPNNKHLFLTDLMRRFRVAYPKPRKNHQPREFMIPVLFEDIEVPKADWKVETAMRFRYDYKQVAPDELLPEFIVENHELIYNEKLRWKRGIYLEYKEEGCIAKIYGSYKDNFIEIEINGNPHLQRDVLAKVRGSLEKLNQLRNMEVERYVIWQGKPLSYEDLLFWRKENEREVSVRGFGRIDINTVWNNFELPDKEKFASHITNHIYTETLNLENKGNVTIYYTQQIENYIAQAALSDSKEGKNIISAIRAIEDTNELAVDDKKQILEKIAEVLQKPTQTKLEKFWDGLTKLGFEAGKDGVKNGILKLIEIGGTAALVKLGEFLVNF